MRISDWSSDVCSSDLTTAKCRRHLRRLAAPEEIAYDEAAATGELCPPLRHVEIETAAKIAVDALKSEASQDGVQRGGEFLAIAGDRKSGVEGKSVAVRLDLGGCRIIKKKTK